MVMNFFYPHTCPTIDRSINGFKQELRNSIQGLFDEIFSEIDDRIDLKEVEIYQNQTQHIDNKSSEIYYIWEKYFEDVRETNSDMRCCAESVIEDMESEHHYRVVELEGEIEDLNQKIELLNEKIYEFQEQNGHY